VWGTCAFANGAYHASQADIHKGNWCAALSTNFSNFAFEAQIKIVKGDFGGLVFRLDYANNSTYSFDVSEYGYYALRLCTLSNCPYIVTPTFNSAIHQGLNQTNIVAVVANANTFTFYVNQKQLTVATDSTYSHGQIALAAWSSGKGSDPTEVVYSNVKVWTF
jgi:hypothetical protein